MRINVGDEAPDFELENHNRQRVRLLDFRGRRNVLIAFHPFAWTPVCANQMAGYEAERRRFDELDTQVLGISIDASPTKAAWAKSVGGISFDLLCDFYPHGAVAELYGVLRREGFSDRAVFLVDKKGTVRYAKRFDIPELPPVEEVLKEVEKIVAGPG